MLYCRLHDITKSYLAILLRDLLKMFKGSLGLSLFSPVAADNTNRKMQLFGWAIRRGLGGETKGYNCIGIYR